MKCEVDSGSQNNPDVWSIQEHIRTKNTNKFWLEKVEDKIDKTKSWIEVWYVFSPCDQNQNEIEEKHIDQIWSNWTKDKVLDVRWKI